MQLVRQMSAGERSASNEERAEKKQEVSLPAAGESRGGNNQRFPLSSPAGFPLPPSIPPDQLAARSNDLFGNTAAQVRTTAPTATPVIQLLSRPSRPTVGAVLRCLSGTLCTRFGHVSNRYIRRDVVSGTGALEREEAGAKNPVQEELGE